MPCRRRAAAALASLLLVAACGADDGGDDVGDVDVDVSEPDGPSGNPRPVPGFDGATIQVGAITATSGPEAAVANAATAGSRAYFDTLNAAGGVDGRFEVEVVVDDGAVDVPTAEVAYEAMKAEVVLFAQVLGTDVVSALLPALVADGVVAAPASLDSQWVREQQLLPIGAPYQVQSANALTWYLEGGNGGTPDDTICALVRDDRYGEAGLEGLEAAADLTDADVAAVITFPDGEDDFTTQVDALRGARCDMVLFVGLPTETAAAIERADSSFPAFTPQWIGQSPAWLGQLAEGDLATYLQEHFVLVSDGTEWGDTSVPGMAQMLEDAPPGQGPSTAFAFGYAQARAVHQVLEAAVAAGDLSREGIVEAMNSIDVLTFDGLTGDYPYGPPEDRDPPRASTIFAVDPEAPGGLRVLEPDVISQAAEDLTFE